MFFSDWHSKAHSKENERETHEMSYLIFPFLDEGVVLYTVETPRLLCDQRTLVVCTNTVTHKQIHSHFNPIPPIHQLIKHMGRIDKLGNFLSQQTYAQVSTFRYFLSTNA